MRYLAVPIACLIILIWLKNPLGIIFLPLMVYVVFDYLEIVRKVKKRFYKPDLRKMSHEERIMALWPGVKAWWKED